MTANTPFSSRHRYSTDIATLFDVFCEVGAGEPDGLAVILTKYPEDYNDETALKSVRQFSFPFGLKEVDSDAVQLFSFVLTDSQSRYTFGYCRFTPRNNTCICILSGFSWPGVFYKILNHVSLIMNKGTQDDLDAILTRIYHTDIPNVGDVMQFECRNGMHKLEVKVPDVTKLPTLREDKFMLEFYNAVSPRQMLAIYARQSVFIPVLPECLFDMIMAPMPFLIGVPKQVMKSGTLKDLGEVVIVDLDDKTLQSAHNDVADIPGEVVMYLKNQLKSSSDMGDSLSRSFLRANVLLFGGYRMGFVRSESTGIVHWDKEKFVREQRPSLQPFLSSLLGTDGVQYLERFIEERCRAINSGLPITDEFENEIGNMDKLKVQAVNPEAIQQAVQSVKENASDVLGALKDRVSGMQIHAKLNKLTPKEIRRPKNWTLKKSSKRGGFEPMSFDNIQWHEPGTGDNSVGRSEGESTSGYEADSDSSQESSPYAKDSHPNVPVANLIDFDAPIENPQPLNNLLSQDSLFSNTASTTFFATPSPSVVAHPQSLAFMNPSASGQPTTVSPLVDPFFDPFKTPTSPEQKSTSTTDATNAKAKNNWETFD
ncbi:uDENN domain protein [Oesophagostomum dentatum]|uniref:UDENN domain protein n=1 Tax=Oesophagostomum dentatum TaxID=61180 RepID=A0A0B1TM10_OESDE|nr:uDENN domain protein [Oesophagostomum dentatum]